MNEHSVKRETVKLSPPSRNCAVSTVLARNNSTGWSVNCNFWRTTAIDAIAVPNRAKLRSRVYFPPCALAWWNFSLPFHVPRNGTFSRIVGEPWTISFPHFCGSYTLPWNLGGIGLWHGEKWNWSWNAIKYFSAGGKCRKRACQRNSVKRNCKSNAFQDASERLALWCLTADRVVCFPLHHNFSFFMDDTRLSFATLHLLEHARTWTRTIAVGNASRVCTAHCYIFLNWQHPSWIWISNMNLIEHRYKILLAQKNSLDINRRMRFHYLHFYLFYL